jgi:hypothetical protein
LIPQELNASAFYELRNTESQPTVKKYLIPAILVAIVAAGIFLRYLVSSPSRALALDLQAINGITVGKTSEADLLGRPAFQTMDRRCFGANCDYHVEHSNQFLSQLHLAPLMFVGIAVSVRDGMVTRVSVFLARQGLTPVVISQNEKLPAGCASSPCMKPVTNMAKITFNFMVTFDSQSELRNRIPELLNTACLSRLRGCNNYAELLPLANELNLPSIPAH